MVCYFVGNMVENFICCVNYVLFVCYFMGFCGKCFYDWFKKNVLFDVFFLFVCVCFEVWCRFFLFFFCGYECGKVLNYKGNMVVWLKRIYVLCLWWLKWVKIWLCFDKLGELSVCGGIFWCVVYDFVVLDWLNLKNNKLVWWNNDLCFLLWLFCWLLWCLLLLFVLVVKLSLMCLMCVLLRFELFMLKIVLCVCVWCVNVFVIFVCVVMVMYWLLFMCWCLMLVCVVCCLMWFCSWLCVSWCNGVDVCKLCVDVCMEWKKVWMVGLGLIYFRRRVEEIFGGCCSVIINEVYYMNVLLIL